MFKNDPDIIPKTYSIKGYRSKSSLSLKKLIFYIVCGILTVAVLGITFLTLLYMAG